MLIIFITVLTDAIVSNAQPKQTCDLNKVSSKLIKLLICWQLMEKHDTEKFLKFLIAKDSFSYIINGQW